MQNDTDVGLFGSEGGLRLEFYYLNQREFSRATAEGISVKNLLTVTTPTPPAKKSRNLLHGKNSLCND